MSHQYPILDNRPIDQWKVTELKEELKRRRLPLKGLKDDLIKRLDEALRAEGENALQMEYENEKKEVESGLNLDPQPIVGSEASEPPSIVNENEMTDAKLHVGINESVETMGDGKLEGGVMMGNEEPLTAETEHAVAMVVSAHMVTSHTLAETSITEVIITGKEVLNSGMQDLNGNSDIQPDSEAPKIHLENEGAKPPNTDDMLDSTALENQVSEVSTSLGFQVNSDSISTDSLPVNEKIELKDNIITDNIELEQNVVKIGMVEPSSANVVPVDGESHPMDVEEPLEKKVFLEERDDNNGTHAAKSEENDILDMGDSEKLNLDRSSGDESIEDDVLESKPIDSNVTADEVGDRIEKTEVGVMMEENPVDIIGKDESAEQKETFTEIKVDPPVSSAKRRLNDETLGNIEPLKRQRKWNSERLKRPEQQSPKPPSSTTPKDIFQPAIPNISWSDSTVNDAPKERVVPPSQKPATNSLKIDRFLRPFTLKAVQELLGKTGKVTSFWMDNIKTHCYVTYSSVEEAVETRNAVYNLQWPPNGGRLLVAEFVEPQEVKMRVEAPPQSPATPITPTATAPAPPVQPSPRQKASLQHLPLPPTLPPPPPLSNPPPARGRLSHQAPPSLPEKIDSPILTLDDLFRKTKSTPRIYYLPLSEEQVAAKLAERGSNSKLQGPISS